MINRKPGELEGPDTMSQTTYNAIYAPANYYVLRPMGYFFHQRRLKDVDEVAKEEFLHLKPVKQYKRGFEILAQ